VRIQCPENLRFPLLGSSIEGESGPKARPTGVVDGKQVNIPVLFYIWYRGTEQVDIRRYWISIEVFKVMKGRRKTILELRNDL
jgi:hypothetical protein